MKIYHDYLSENSELFSDAENFEYDKELIGHKAKLVPIGGGVDESKFGANKSAEAEDEEQCDEPCEMKMSCDAYFGVKKMDPDLMTKKFMKKYWLKYYNCFMKKVKEEGNTALLDELKSKGQASITQWLDFFDSKEDDIFGKHGEEGDFDFDEPKTPLFIAKYSTDGKSITLWTINSCLVGEKC